MTRRCALSFSFAVLAAGLLAGCTGPTPAVTPAAPASVAGAPRNEVDALLARMTLEQKVGQIVVVGFDGPAYDGALREMIERHHIGGVIFFARNVESPAQVARLTNALQSTALAANGIGLFTAIDQEGGRVARLTTGKGFTEFPGAMALSATARDAKRAAANTQRVGAAMAAEMLAVGLNVDFAPDLDVNNNPANPVIGIRSFGSDPHRVAELGVAFVEGLQGGGVLAFGKHFPGHGDTGTDSHLDLPVVGHARARLEAVEFVPFRATIARGMAGIMSAHVSFPTIDATPGLPGTLSSKVLTDLLRTELKFDGLVATDSLEMGALGKSGFPGPRAAARALQAGADLLLFNAGHEIHRAAITQILADVRSGATPMARLDQAVRRALTAKARFGLLKPAAVNVEAAAKICGSAEHRALAAEMAAASVTLLRDDAARLPLKTTSTPVVISTLAGAGLAGALRATELRVHESPDEPEIAATLKALQSHRGAPVILTLSGARAGSGQSAFAQRVIATGAPVILVALREPYDLLPPAGSGAKGAGPTLVATYGVNPATLQALVAVLRGTSKPAGHSPVDLPGLYRLGAGLEDFVKR